MTTYSFETEKKYQITARSVATAFGIVFLILFFFNLLTYQDPKPGQAGILVSFGQPNIGQGEEVSAPPPAAAEEEKVEEETQPEEVVPEEPEPEVTKPDPVKPEKTTPKKDVVEDARSKEIALKKKQEDEKKRQEEITKRAKELEAKKKADAAKKAKAEADAKKAAEAKAKQDAADKLKGEIGGLFGQDGDGKGNTGTSGNQGDPNGDPNASNLDGISTGSGMVGGGLGNRGGAGPAITDKSQATGIVVVKVCVDTNGKVISAKFTQSGSNTTDTQLRRLAEDNAKKWKFKSASLDGNQCGTITYNFKVK